MMEKAIEKYADSKKPYNLSLKRDRTNELFYYFLSHIMIYVVTKS